MGQSRTVGVRQSIRVLQSEYDNGNTKPLENIVRAWKGIEELPPTDPRSFFILGGFHGEPFLLRPQVDKLSKTDVYAYWGGYCNHGNVLFPTWHRVYVKKLEEALQSIVPGVMMPFWDQTDAETLEKGIPSILTDEIFCLDGELIPNPLKSFVLPKRIKDNYWGDNISDERSAYFKPKRYETVRYPLSGLVGNPRDRAATKKHNATYPDPQTNVVMLNDNVRTWLYGGDPTPRKPDPHGVGIYQKFQNCLLAPNYTVFSNTTSAEAWNNAGNSPAMPLESPHNDIHLAVGGFDLPLPQFGGKGSTSGQVKGANGDMGENNTAALDPIFFFHHCNVDRMFWLWQKQNPRKKVEIIEGYAGTNSSDSQGPTSGMAPGTALTTKTQLRPFKNLVTKKWYTSEDCIDTDKQLGYTYGPGSLETKRKPRTIAQGLSRKVLVVRGMNRAHFTGSFIVSAQAEFKDRYGKVIERRHLGHDAVLSRWNVEGCANCQTHLDVVARFPLKMLTDDEVKRAEFSVQIGHRREKLHRNVKLRVSVEG